MNMAGQANVKQVTISVDSRPVKVWTGGQGDPLLLVHGGWGGAAMHWAPVWDELAKQFRVIAPELPGIGEWTAPGLRTFGEYAQWLERLLDALGAGSAWVAGNSFGASVSWQLAARASNRCRGLVMVNGAPPIPIPPLGRFVLRLPGISTLFTAWFRRQAWAPSSLPRFVADPRLAPPELVRVLTNNPHGAVERLVDIVLAGDAPGPTPAVPILILWGEADRGMASPGAVHRLQRSIVGSTLVFIPAAGHLPQVEKPAEFVAALRSFVAGASQVPSRCTQGRPGECASG